MGSVFYKMEIENPIRHWKKLLVLSTITLINSSSSSFIALDQFVLLSTLNIIAVIIIR